MRRGPLNLACLSLVVTLFGTGPAWAYLDPGTGSMLLQGLLGGIAGAMVVGRLYWHRLREFVTSRLPRKSASAGRAHTSSRVAPPGE